MYIFSLEENKIINTIFFPFPFPPEAIGVSNRAIHVILKLQLRSCIRETLRPRTEINGAW